MKNEKIIKSIISIATIIGTFNSSICYAKDYTEDKKVDSILIAVDSEMENDYIKRELTLEEKEAIVKYKFSLDDNELKDVICEMMAEAPGAGTNYTGLYEVASLVLNRYNSYRWNKNNKTLHDIITAEGQFTTYKVGYWFKYFYNLDEKEYKNLPAYAAAINCFYTENSIHSYSQFRSKNSSIGVQLSKGSNRFLDKLEDDEYRPLEERGYYQKMQELLLDKNHELYDLVMVIEDGVMPSLDKCLENQKEQEEKILQLKRMKQNKVLILEMEASLQ